MRRLTASLLAVTALSAALLLDTPSYLAYRADASYRSGETGAAVSTWTTLARVPGKEPAARYNRGVALSRMGNYSAAVADFRAAASSPDSTLRSRALYNIGTCRLLQSRGRGGGPETHVREAVVALQQSLALSPSDRDAAANLEEARRRLGSLSNDSNKRHKAPEPLPARSEGNRGERRGEAKERVQAETKPGKATAEDQAAGKRRPALPTGQALRMLDEARGKERLMSAVGSAEHAAAVTAPEKDW